MIYPQRAKRMHCRESCHYHLANDPTINSTEKAYSSALKFIVLTKSCAATTISRASMQVVNKAPMPTKVRANPANSVVSAIFLGCCREMSFDVYYGRLIRGDCKHL